MDRLEALQAFIRVVDTGSFTDVAEEMRVTQPTVSKWIQALEEEFSVPLLERTTRSHRVTDSGRVAYEQAKEILGRFDFLVSGLSEPKAALRGRIRLSVPVVFGRRHLVPLLARFLRQHQELELDLEMSDRYVSLVEDGFDCAVRVGIPLDSTLRSVPLGVTERQLVAAPSYLKSHGVPKKPQDLKQHECLLFRGSAPVWSFEKSGSKTRARVRGRVVANNTDALLELAREGQGLALLADWLISEDLKSGRLRATMKSWKAPPAPIQALLPPGKYTSPRVRALLRYLQEQLQLPAGIQV